MDDPEIPSTFQVGTTTLDVSVLDIPSKLTKVVGQLTTVLKILYILGIVGIILTGVLILVSPILFIAKFRRPIIHLGIGLIATLAAVLLLLTALLQSIIAILIGSIINQLASGFGISAKAGVPLLVIAWISVILVSIPATILLNLWFNGVYIRRAKVALEKKRIPVSRNSLPMSRNLLAMSVDNSNIAQAVERSRNTANIQKNV